MLVPRIPGTGEGRLGDLEILLSRNYLFRPATPSWTAWACARRAIRLRTPGWRSPSRARWSRWSRRSGGQHPAGGTRRCCAALIGMIFLKERSGAERDRGRGSPRASSWSVL